MQIIEKETITIDNVRYLLLGIDSDKNEYYILDVDTEEQFERIGMVYHICDNKLVNMQDYELYSKNLNEITHSTLTNEELDILTNTLKDIKNLKISYKILMYNFIGMGSIQRSPESLLKERNTRILDTYSMIRNLLL